MIFAVNILHETFYSLLLIKAEFVLGLLYLCLFTLLIYMVYLAWESWIKFDGRRAGDSYDISMERWQNSSEQTN